MLDFDRLPPASNRRIAVHVTPAAERALRAGHPWLFDEGIRRQSHAGQAGDLAVLLDSRRRFLAIGLYDPNSPIRVKVLQHREQAIIDREWFANRLQAAALARQTLAATDTNGYRLVHGENDGFPGLVVDRYAETLVVKLYTAAWLPHLQDVVAGLQSAQPFERLVLRFSRQLGASMTPYGLQNGQVAVGPALAGPVIFKENGLRFAADVVAGHKTGFFFDHRDNRARVRLLSGGRDVLDVFAYSGGFSVYAAAGGAKSVTSLDVSAPALEAAKRNFALNRDAAHGAANPGVEHAKHKVIADDAFTRLERLQREGERYSMVIADPPSFAKRKAETARALAAYARLTRLALDVLKPGGVLMMASCSSRVSTDAFFDTVTQTARNAGRPLVEIERTGHALDHPIGFPEGAYLKCLFATAAR